jgi:hypothetical protein
MVCAAALSAQNPNNPVTIGNSESLFTVLAAINTCGFDAELANSETLRQTVRGEIGRAVENSEAAKTAADAVCSFYRDHQQADDVRTLSQYVSLALYLGPPPKFAPKVKDSDLPPDASGVLGLVPLLDKFYSDVAIHQIWQSHAQAYADVEARYRDALAKMIQDTELYLRLPSGSYLGRTFTIYLEPMGAPSEINARSYGNDYFVVITPGTKTSLKMDQIHHAYLHYLLDPMVGRYAGNLAALEPVLDAVKLSPMDESFKSDPALLTTECVIRAIEARTMSGGKASPEQQEQAVQESASMGFVLTRYFYEKLLEFEKDDIGFRNALPQMIAGIDVRKEAKRAAQVQFADAADPELLQLPRPKKNELLTQAQDRLSAGDVATAEKLAKEALAEKTEDPGRALFILAQVSTANRNVDAAQNYFEQAIKSTNEPKVIAWSHIYLGRILDLRAQNDDDENGPLRQQAISHYKAAEGASDTLPEAKAAAEQGLAKPYEPAKSAQQSPSGDDDSKQ